MKKLLILSCLAIANISCKKETNIYYPESTQSDSTALSVIDPNYGLSHDFIVLDRTKTPLNANISWHLQEVGKKEVYIISNDKYPGLPEYYWKYDKGSKVGRKDLWEVLKSKI